MVIERSRDDLRLRSGTGLRNVIQQVIERSRNERDKAWSPSGVEVPFDSAQGPDRRYRRIQIIEWSRNERLEALALHLRSETGTFVRPAKAMYKLNFGIVLSGRKTGLTHFRWLKRTGYSSFPFQGK